MYFHGQLNINSHAESNAGFLDAPFMNASNNSVEIYGWAVESASQAVTYQI